MNANFFTVNSIVKFNLTVCVLFFRIRFCQRTQVECEKEFSKIPVEKIRIPHAFSLMFVAAKFVGLEFREKTIDAFFLGSKEDKATHVSLALPPFHFHVVRQAILPV